MNALAIIEQARTAGLALSLDGDQLRVRGKQTAGALAIIEQMRLIKPAIVQALQRGVSQETRRIDMKITPDAHQAKAQKRVWGKIAAGAAMKGCHYQYAISQGSPLYQQMDSREYKRWLWNRIQDDDNADDNVICALYEIINGAYLGSDVYVEGPHADIIVAAIGWLLNQYKVQGVSIL